MTEHAIPLTDHAPVDRELEIKVRFHELDPNGHLNHGIYLTWFETARIEVMERLGLPLQTLRARRIHLVVVEANVRYRRPVVAGETVTIDSRVGELRRASGWWHQTVWCDGERRADADVRSTVVTPEGRPTRAPQDLIDALTSLQTR